jgi:hypothetical protein
MVRNTLFNRFIEMNISLKSINVKEIPKPCEPGTISTFSRHSGSYPFSGRIVVQIPKM